MAVSGECAGFDDEEGETEVHDGGGECKEEVGAGVEVAVRFEIETGESAFEYPKKDQATDKDCGAVERRYVIEVRFHIREFSYGFNGYIKLQHFWGIKRLKVAVVQYFIPAYVGDRVMYKRKIIST